MSFEIQYSDTAGNETTADLLPGSSLTQRARIEYPQKNILFVNKLEISLLLLANFIWEIERILPNFYDFQTAENPSSVEIQRQNLFIVLQKILTNTNSRISFSKTLMAIAAVKKKDGVFVLPLDNEEPHNYESISDQQIADFIQVTVVDDLSNVLQLI